jgi:hypothetical protein
MRFRDTQLRSRLGRALPVLVLGFAAAVIVLLAALLLSSDGGRSRVAPSHARDAGGRPSGMGPSPGGPALHFADTYVEFLYGRAAAPAVTPITTGLRSRLTGGRSVATPAERQRKLSVRDVQVTYMGRGTATARALVDDGASPPYTLSFNLSLIGGRWAVTDVWSQQ